MGDKAKSILSLDMSTTCTGWALLEADSMRLLQCGLIKPSTRGGVAKMEYPKQQLTKMIDIGNQIDALIRNLNPDFIVIEEIAGSKNRMGQKTLDGLHFIVVWIIEEHLSKVHYYDVTGASGWRTHLQLRLSDADKLANKEAKVLNKKLVASQRIPIIGTKHLSTRFVNSQFGLSLNFDTAETDGDLADAISMGYAFLKYRFAKVNK